MACKYFGFSFSKVALLREGVCFGKIVLIKLNQINVGMLRNVKHMSDSQAVLNGTSHERRLLDARPRGNG